MAETVKRPQRAVEVRIGIGADTEQDAVWQLRELASEVERNGLPRSQVTGGGSVSLIIATHRTGEEMSVAHARYFHEVDAWLEQERAVRPETAEVPAGVEPAP